jgi:tripartite ATP-independent transporter DctM subunit
VADSELRLSAELTASAPAALIPAGNRLGSTTVRTVVDRIFEAVTGVLLALLVATVFVAAMSRYVFNASVVWAEEIPDLIQVWLTFLGGVVTLRRGDHVSVDALFRKLPARWLAPLRAAVELLTIGLLLTLLWTGSVLVKARLREYSPALGFSMSLFMLPLVIGAGVMALSLARHVLALPLRVAGAALLAVAVVAAVLLGIDRATGGLVAFFNPLALLLASFAVLLLLDTPISFAFGIVSVVYLWFAGIASLTVIPQRLVAGPSSFMLTAVPLFILAGALMEAGGISRRLVGLVSSVVGHIRGGLAMVVVFSAILFYGISGSAVADVSAVGSILLPAMKRAGYRAEESVSIVSAASATGILVPPSILMIILAFLANLSVVRLFVAGLVPTVVLAAGLTGLILYKAHREGWPRGGKATWGGRLRAVRDAALPLLSPVIMVGGFISGIVTVTEAAVLGVIYALVVGGLVYRELTLASIYRVFVSSGSATGMAFWLIGMASVFSWILAIEQTPDLLGRLLSAAPGGSTTFIVFSIFIFIVLGGMLDGMPALLILGPVFFPIATSLGIDLVHYGIVIIAAMGIGLFLPAVGVGMFIAVGIGRVEMGATAVRYLPYLLMLIGMLIVVGSVPWLTDVLPRFLLGP